MKKMLSFSLCLSALAIWSCSDNNSSASGSANDSTSSTTMTTVKSDSSSNSTTMSSNPTNTSSAPLSKMDSTFVMKAAVGGMTEVEMGKLAQQNGMSDRVKAFGAAMVADHSKANDELKSYASMHGMTLPATLPADKQKDVDMMKKMMGKSFDMHYVGMMVDDHKKTVDMFKTAASGADDADLKAWAGKTLPTLQMHLDSIQAIKSAKM